MRIFLSTTSAKNTILFLASTLCFSVSNITMAISADEASQQVKIQSCKDNQTVEQILDQSVRSHSQRDIGWRTFQEEGYYDVERAVLINKGMELRYRWRVTINGDIKPENERAEKLCIAST